MLPEKDPVTLCKQDSSWASEFPAEPSEGTHTKAPCTGLCRAPLAQAVRALLRCPESTCLIPLGFSAGRGTTGPWVGPSCQHHALVVLLGHKPPLTTLFFTTIFVPLTSDLIPSDGEKL